MPLILPSPQREKRLYAIQKWLTEHKEENSHRALGRAVTLMLEEPDFRQQVALSKELSKGVSGPGAAVDLSWTFLMYQLSRRDMVAASMVLWDAETFTAKPHCVQLIWNALMTKRMICVIGGGGLGKCLGPDVRVLMFDGSVKPAKDVMVGDVLMGDDGTKRTVLQANPGYGPMYRIRPERGEPWTCNGDHILSLRCGYDKPCGNGQPSTKRVKNMVVDVPLNEYITWSKSKKEYFHSFHVGADFSEKGLPFDPYIYGAWIGDGGFDVPALHTPDGPMARRWVEYFSALPGFHVTSGYHDKCPMWCARWKANGIGGGGRANPFTDFIRTSRKNGEKIVLDSYLRNSRRNRLALLAGLIDSDGWVEGGRAYAFCTKHATLAEQVCWLARSLGFAATFASRIKTIKSIGFSGSYWTVYISGNGLTEIPTLEKHAKPSITNKNLCNTRFFVEPIGDGDFYGFVIDGNRRFLLGDFTVTHNTYSPSAYFLLEYILDPIWTRVQVASASEDHLLGNLFADIGRLHSGASMALPGKHDTESISLDKKKAQGIFTLTLPGGTSGKSKIKGVHTKPRDWHPLFGRRSRVFCLIDEAQEIPENAFDEIANRFSTVDGDDIDHLKFLVSANPREIFSKFGKIAKPVGGWEAITRDSETWESEKGWTVVSLDQTKHENYVQRRQVFPGFATYQGVQIRLRDCDGDENDPRMFTYCYGKFPEQGTTFAVIKQRHLLASEGEWIFGDATVAIAGVDPAFTSDRPAFAAGRIGRAIAWTDSAGVRHELKEAKTVIQIDAVTVLPRGDSQDLADACLDRLKDLGVLPSGFGIDQTGVGRGTADVIRRQWGQKVSPIEGFSAPIHGIEFGSSPTVIKIAEEDTKTPMEMFDRVASEIWYAAAKLFELDSVRIGKAVDIRVMAELASRKGDMQRGLGKKLTVETKDEYKRRTKGDSPDLADATLIMIHAARMSTAGLVPRSKDTVPSGPAHPGEWDGFSEVFGAVELAGFGGEKLPDLMVD